VRRLAILVVVTLVVVLVALGFGLRRVSPGQAVWAREQGTLLRAGDDSEYVTRWAWQPAGDGRVAGSLAAASREGARVDVFLDVRFPPGRFTLVAAATPEEGLKQTVEAGLRARLAALPMTCFTGMPQVDCLAGLEVELTDRVSGKLGVRREALSLRVVPDPTALAAARRAALRERVGRPPRRVLLVGWDGADWELLEPFARRGVMPNLDRLMRAGSWGELASITPLLSPLIWTTMATGAGPEEHGILDFVEVAQETGIKVPITGRQRRVPALWNMASAAGLSVAVAGWWATWPAEPVNGVLISDRLFVLLSDTVAEGPPGTVVFPPTLEAEFRRLAERADVETDEAAVRALLPVSGDAYRAARGASRHGRSDRRLPPDPGRDADVLRIGAAGGSEPARPLNGLLHRHRRGWTRARAALAAAAAGRGRRLLGGGAAGNRALLLGRRSLARAPSGNVSPLRVCGPRGFRPRLQVGLA
jgi:hypothetical protein